MKRVRHFVLVLVSVVFVVAVSACGGGGSGSGGGGAGGAGAKAPYMGTYQGLFTMILSAPGVPTQNMSGTTTIVVNTDNSVVVDPGPNQFPGTYNPATQQMTASFPGTDIDPSCTGVIFLNGNHAINAAGTHTMNGTAGSNNLSCFNIGMTVGGSFQTSQVNTTTLSRGGHGIVETIQQFLER